MTYQTEIMTKAAILMMGSAITAGISMIETAAPFIEKLGLPIALAVAALWLAVKSNQGRIADKDGVIAMLLDEIKSANSYRGETLDVLKSLDSKTEAQTKIIEANQTAIIRALEKHPHQ